jgi:hypothetical protein
MSREGRPVISALGVVLGCTFVALAAWHFYWAAGGRRGKRAAIPEIRDVPAFAPSPYATAAVGFVLALCAVLVVAQAGLLAIIAPRPLLSWLCDALALVLLGRAVGDFRLVGFFKRVRGSDFARLDSIVYSPLCLALAAGVFAVAIGGTA